jgi:hypothetical protein
MLSIKLDVRAATEQYAAQNEVRGFRAGNGMAGMAGDVPTFAPTKPTAAPSKGSAPPWAKR